MIQSDVCQGPWADEQPMTVSPNMTWLPVLKDNVTACITVILLQLSELFCVLRPQAEANVVVTHADVRMILDMLSSIG